MANPLTMILSGGMDKIISSFGTVLDNLFTSKEEKSQAEVAKLTLLLQAEQLKNQLSVELEKAYIEDQKSLREQVIVEIQSQDWFVRRARPAVIWMGIVLVFWNYMLTPMVQTLTHLIQRQPVVVTLVEVPDLVWYVWGGLMGGIAALRSYDKKNILGTPEAAPAK